MKKTIESSKKEAGFPILLDIGLPAYHWCFTQTFKPEISILRPLFIVRQWRSKMVKYCKSRKISYYLVAEFSPKSGNYHFHGVMKFPDDSSKTRFANWAKRNFGLLRFEVCKDLPGWTAYCYKQWEENIKTINPTLLKQILWTHDDQQKYIRERKRAIAHKKLQQLMGDKNCAEGFTIFSPSVEK